MPGLSLLEIQRVSSMPSSASAGDSWESSNWPSIAVRATRPPATGMPAPRCRDRSPVPSPAAAGPRSRAPALSPRSPRRRVFFAACSAVTHAPPQFQPLHRFTPSAIPKRSASRTACLNISRHSGLMKCGPRGAGGPAWPASNSNAPLIPCRFISSKSRVIPSLLAAPLSHHQ